MDKITSKTNKTLGLLRRNVKTDNTEVKQKAFKPLVQPVLDYTSCVWDQHTQKDINKVHAGQRRRVRYIINRFHNTSSPTQMFSDLDLEPPATRRFKINLYAFYKTHHGFNS